MASRLGQLCSETNEAAAMLLQAEPHVKASPLQLQVSPSVALPKSPLCGQCREAELAGCQGAQISGPRSLRSLHYYLRV